MYRLSVDEGHIRTSDGRHESIRQEDELFRPARGLYVLVDATERSTHWHRANRLADVTS
jgi:hypothetical protein